MHSFHNDSKSRSYFSCVTFINIQQINNFSKIRNTQSPGTDFVLNRKTEKFGMKQKK